MTRISTSRLIQLLIEVPAVAVTFTMMLHISANALLRTFFNDSLPNTLEIVQYWYMPILVFLGFVAAQHRGQHIAADLLFEKLPHQAKRFVAAATFALCAVVAFGFARYGWHEAMKAMEIRRPAGVTMVPSWPTYFLPTLAFSIMTVQFAWASISALVRLESIAPATDSPDAVLSELDVNHNFDRTN
ncbi:TRAP transporter small permease [Rhodococcus pseudokoreensis]|uniref:TRAP transporter small permease n=1 Tax=Rhodococcus pseudokoreensis TaxID=2811421 RepID=A0A974W4X5_9NOCA|nr:TRAP transporter small permease [Rhodococcus pseudokoreensis]QSE90785.1 TRAP transporter small permease [Rhodococcus pseudokoreensis]